jgi:hypothetical protein
MDSNFLLFWMIVDKGGEEIGLKLQDLSLKILGVEIKFASPCVRLVSVFPVSVCQVSQIGLCDRSDWYCVHQNSSL